MPSCNLERRVPYTADQMFDLVIDVEHYQDFMPLEFNARIIERGTANIRASQAIRMGPIPLAFESTATFHRPEWIRIESTSSPFSYFLIAWTFTKLELGCTVRVHVACTTHLSLLAALLAPWMETFTRQLIASFETRAKDIYGMAPAS